jgi:hypothetical protein
MGCDGDFGFVRAPFLRLPLPFRDSLSRPIPGGPSSSPSLPPAWLPSRFFSLDEAGLASFIVEMIDAIGRYPFEARKLVMVFGWLRSALSRRSLGLGCILPGRCGMAPAAPRPVKIATVTMSGRFRKTRATLTSERMHSACQTPLGPRGFTAQRPPRSWLTRAARNLSANSP